MLEVEEQDEKIFDEEGDRESLLGKIADQVSQLSESQAWPKGFELRGQPFPAIEAEWQSNEWISRVLAVQGWLYLTDDVSGSADPEETALQLFRAFAPNAEALITSTNGMVTLTALGEEVLSARLDRAVKHCDEFLEDIESMNSAQATELWQEKWDDDPEFEDKVEPITAIVDTWPIKEFKDNAIDNKLILNPSYQRADVWPTTDAQILIESILKGIPLPSIIILKSKTKKAYEVVDGKQRLTSILRFMGYHREAIERVRSADEKHKLNGQLEKCFHENYKKFRRLWAKHTGEKLTGTKEREYYFPFKLRSDKYLPERFAQFANQYYYEIKEIELSLGGDSQTIGETFERASAYKLPVIIYKHATPRQIHEVFNLYNQQGKHLNAEEIRNAVYHEVDLVRLLLVAAGDNSNVRELAAFVDEALHPLLGEISQTLNGYRFGIARYKRTKALSWLCAMLFQPALNQDTEKTGIRSTKAQIDRLLRQIQTQPDSHPLARSATLDSLVRDLHRCLEVHSSVDVWAPKFRDNGNGEKWQELQLIASLLGTFLACIAFDDAEDRFEDNVEAIAGFTAKHLRPAKTQNKHQWKFIASVSLGVLDLLDVDRKALGAKLQSRYGYSCLATLQEAAELA